MPYVDFFSAFLGGVLTFLMPCTLPLIPAYIGFLGGTTSGSASEAVRGLRRRIYINALLFVLGFSLIFIFFGLISGVLGKFLRLHGGLISSLGGIIVILFGLVMVGVVPFPRFFSRVSLPSMLQPGRPFSSFLLGILFALGWSPCLGPILGTILFLAGATGTAFYGAALLATYALGLAIPFLVVAILYGTAFTYVTSLSRYLPIIEKSAGVLLIAIGSLLVFGQFGLTAVWVEQLFSGSWYSNVMHLCDIRC